MCGSLLDPAPNTLHTQLLWCALRGPLWDACFHFLQLCGFWRRLDRSFLHWLRRRRGPCPHNTRRTAQALYFLRGCRSVAQPCSCQGGLKRFAKRLWLPNITCVCYGILKHLRTGLRCLRCAGCFLLTCDSFDIGLGTEPCRLLLLCGFFGFDSSELIDNIGIFLGCALALVRHVNEVTHRSGGFRGLGLYLFWCRYVLQCPTSGVAPSAFQFKRKQVRLLKRSFISTPRGSQAFPLTCRCLRTLFFFEDGGTPPLKREFFWRRLALGSALPDNCAARHVTEYCFTL